MYFNKQAFQKTRQRSVRMQYSNKLFIKKTRPPPVFSVQDLHTSSYPLKLKACSLAGVSHVSDMAIAVRGCEIKLIKFVKLWKFFFKLLQFIWIKLRVAQPVSGNFKKYLIYWFQYTSNWHPLIWQCPVQQPYYFTYWSLH